MLYNDSFGSVKKIRLSPEDRVLLEKCRLNIEDKGLRELFWACIEEYDKRRKKSVQNSIDMGMKPLESICTGFFIFVPNYMIDLIKIMGTQTATELKDFFEQFYK
ncbi:MAG: hypothetical protein J6N21_13345 [Butyrivibrio sp.]|nr:hypothetical protein [Butyrivibrio sp.]